MIPPFLFCVAAFVLTQLLVTIKVRPTIPAEKIQEIQQPLNVQPVVKAVEVKNEASSSAVVVPTETPTHIAVPKMVKGIYLTAHTVQSRTRFNNLLALVDKTELNSMVIDVKLDTGALAFAPIDPILSSTSSTLLLPPLETLTNELHRHGIYAIARIFVFEDPWLAENSSAGLKIASGTLWADAKGIHWVDPAAESVWQYNVTLAKEVWNRGFDEVQFDYIRFPTDGNTKSIVYPVWNGTEKKYEVMTRFFQYLHDNLVQAGIPTSVDLFGLTVRKDASDLGIGQRTKDALPYVSYVSPMMYPSHYYAGSYGIAVPAEHPGEIVTIGMRIGRELMASSTPVHASIRPWLQDFNIGAVYDAAKVRAQITAAESGGASGWLLWNAKNVYTAGALLPK